MALSSHQTVTAEQRACPGGEEGRPPAAQEVAAVRTARTWGQSSETREGMTTERGDAQVRDDGCRRHMTPRVRPIKEPTCVHGLSKLRIALKKTLLRR